MNRATPVKHARPSKSTASKEMTRFVRRIVSRPGQAVEVECVCVGVNMYE
jgi:hypothetical protein